MRGACASVGPRFRKGRRSPGEKPGSSTTDGFYESAVCSADGFCLRGARVTATRFEEGAVLVARAGLSGDGGFFEQARA
jgi:hypothetical protein